VKKNTFGAAAAVVAEAQKAGNISQISSRLHMIYLTWKSCSEIIVWREFMSNWAV
jgi:hypothetical protein